MRSKTHYIIITIMALLMTACSTISNLEPGEQLYVGLKPIDYTNIEPSVNASVIKEEIEAALATAPNGALFGSSYYRTPFPYGLWIWNACNGSSGVIKKWLNNSFGKAPVLMSNVNPVLRSNVARSVLQNNGFFNGDVKYDIIEGKSETTKRDSIPAPRTAKIQYHVNFGHLYTLDSIRYTNYPDEVIGYIDNNKRLLHYGDPFSIAVLDNERNRIYQTLRNKGYYFYKPSYTSYLADTLFIPGKVLLQAHLADSLPEEALRKWVICTSTVQIKREARETVDNSMTRRYLTIKYGGNKPPLRPGVILRDVKIRPGDLFSQDAYQEALNNLASQGIFSSSDITFTPRVDSLGNYVTVPDSIKVDKQGIDRTGAGVLDMVVNATLDKPYDVVFLANAKGKTNDRLGPGLSIGFTKRNIFRGGGQFTATAGANYEFQLGGEMNMGNSYDFSLDLSLTMPRLVAPTFMQKMLRKRWHTTPSTVLTLAGEMIRRAGFFNRKVLKAEYTYIFQPSACSVNQLTPISVTYGRTSDMTDAYIEKVHNSVMARLSTQDEMTFKMRYKYLYSSPERYRNPFFLDATITEAGNIGNLLNMATTGARWDDKGRTILGTPFSQFVKLELDMKKTFSIGEKSSLVLHFNGGAMSCFGNMKSAPFSEHFYIGGANDLRGFSMRSLGPGSVHVDDSQMGYMFHNGDLKLVGNVEYRHHLFGSLYTALFLDAGNVWYMDKDYKELFEGNMNEYGNPQAWDCAIDAGIGIRYDLSFFVLRLDWGFVLHAPYKTSASGFFNIPKFKNAQNVTFAIGYPF